MKGRILPLLLGNAFTASLRFLLSIQPTRDVKSELTPRTLEQPASHGTQINRRPPLVGSDSRRVELCSRETSTPMKRRLRNSKSQWRSIPNRTRHPPATIYYTMLYLCCRRED